jgi:hypothetical protein
MNGFKEIPKKLLKKILRLDHGIMPKDPCLPGSLAFLQPTLWREYTRKNKSRGETLTFINTTWY